MIEALGADTLIYARTPGTSGGEGVQLVSRQSARTALRPGDAVGLDVAPNHFHLFGRDGQLNASAKAGARA